jgi:flagellar basal body-associated protein FliL
MVKLMWIALVVTLLVVAATLRCLWWFWTMHEQDAMRERMRQRATGGTEPLNSWARYQQRVKERER